MNTWKRKSLAVGAVALLSVPSALGVYAALLPTRGPVGAGLAAAGFELVYISTALLILSDDLRRYARRVALAAVATAIVLNTLADYAHRVPGGLASAAQAAQAFDPLALALALIESVPLAGLAYAMAELLHRLSDAPEQPGDGAHDAPALTLALARQEAFPAPEMVDEAEAMKPGSEAINAPYACPSCGAPLPTAGALGAARRWGHCPSCKAR